MIKKVIPLFVTTLLLVACGQQQTQEQTTTNATTADYDIFDTMKNYTGPVLIVHGTQDNIAPYRYSQQAIETFNDAQLITIDGAGHFFSNAQIQGFMPQVDDFIKNHLH